MLSRSRYLGPLALAVLLSFGGCGNGSEGAAEPAETLTGVIGSVEPAEGNITSFELVRPGEDPSTIRIDPALDYGFDLQHLHEHMDSIDPVRVTIDERDGVLYATSIDDV